MAKIIKEMCRESRSNRTSDRLEQDILELILLRIPFKFLLSLRYVSKSWNQLISDPNFEKLHLEIGQKPTHKILICTDSSIQSFDYEASSFNDTSALANLFFPFKKPRINLIILGSCNGLVFCAIDPLKNFFIWNPFTGIYKCLPNPDIPLGCRTPIGGFGYDASTNDHKAILATLYQNEDRNIYVWVYSLRRGAWRVKRFTHEWVRYEVSTDPRGGLYLNGRLHWMRCAMWDIDFLLEPIDTLVFDLTDELFYIIPFPETLIFMYRLGILGKHLCVSIDGDEGIDFWLLQKDSWSLSCQTDMENFLIPLCLTNGGQVITQCDNQSLSRYDPVENKNQVLEITKEMITDAFVYLESPICPRTLYKTET